MQPKEWSRRPNEWLSSLEIDQVLRQYAAACPHFHYTDFGFIDFAADVDSRLPARPDFEPAAPPFGTHDTGMWTDPAELARAQPAASKPAQCVQPKICGLDIKKLVRENKVCLIGSVLNLSRHVEEGTHWVFALLFLPPPPLTSGLAPQMIYFDSTAAPPPPEIVAWHKKLQAECEELYPPSTPHLPLRVNMYPRQSSDTECGMFVLYAMVSIVQGAWLKDTPDTAPATCTELERIPTMLNELLSKGGTKLSDDVVSRYRSVLFVPTE